MNYKISRSMEYALMALSYMSTRPNQCISAREMTQNLHCPFHPFSRVLQKMTDQDLIQAKKGIGGGYIFSTNPYQLSLYTLMKALLSPIEIAACLSGHCDLLEHCNIRNPIHYLNKKILEFYKTLNVQDILNCGQINPSNKRFINKNYQKKMKATKKILFNK